MTSTENTYYTDISGKYANVRVYLPKEEIEDTLWDQLHKKADSPAFENGKIRIMPDGHYSSAATIGFTMPYNGRVVPDTVGVDIGCGVYGIQLENITREEIVQNSSKLDSILRENVPVGQEVHGWDRDYHFVNDFPWDKCTEKLQMLSESLGVDLQSKLDFDGYGEEYIKSLCQKVGYPVNKVICSQGTLGGGNHFIEFGEDSNKSVWVVIHSGSRGIGSKIGDYWIDKATPHTEHFREKLQEYPSSYFKFDPVEVSNNELIRWITGGFGEDWKNMDVIQTDYDSNPEQIEVIREELVSLKYDFLEQSAEEYDYLEPGYEYLIDMIFAQTYAEENRRLMGEIIVETLTEYYKSPISITKSIQSVHNYIDFTDLVVRKGATKATDGTEFLIPLHMGKGVIIGTGKGNPDWNNSGPHGAGRRMSRTAIEKQTSQEDVEKSLKNIIASEKPIQESPQAYKDPELIESLLEPTAEYTDLIKSFYNIKAPEEEYF